ncbi:ABC transporter ATP-binding protein [Gordonia soli]|uniref:Putative ABC transporter ATP-binding protein n=1 Tax=Gordonia soli NBRC 108243 TaxID=1223545 RepID=M0QP82_9ACTN|nr:ABC transporter ATP-binding protein [Gordonia soli]GAC70465.1 putative ABC transporter ATP-binding protein [Gordonia soli NBRC 108243]
MTVDYHGVDVHIGGVEILRNVTVHAPAGSFLGVIGPNGSGKSTMLRCLYRAIDPTSGSVAVAERDVTSISMRVNAQQVAALTQRTALDFEFSAAEVVATGRLPHRSLTTRTAQRDRDICAAAMRDAGVSHLSDRNFTSLSGGEAQRVLIARAFAQQPQVLVLDEPTNHLDVRHQYAVLRAATDRGVTVVAALHDLNIAAQFCDRLAVLVDGRVVQTGTPRELFTPSAIRRWFGIGCHVFDHPRLGVPQIIFDEKETG